MRTLIELRARRAELTAGLKALLELAKTEDRDLSDEERSKWDAADVEIKSLEDAITRGERVAELELRNAAPAATPPAPSMNPPRQTAPAFHQKETRAYSLMNLFQAMKSQDPRLCTVERRASDELAERLGKTPEGVFVPYEALLPRRARETRDITKGTTGAAMVGTDLLPQEFIELLRNESVVVKAGARVVDGLVGDVDMPRQIAAAAATWRTTETEATPTDTTWNTDTVSLSPKTVSIRVDITRKMLKQSSPGIEEVVRTDIRESIGLAVDSAAINGTGASGQPTGIVNTAGVGQPGLLTAPTWADVVEFETDLAAANALRGSLSYVINATHLGLLKTTLRDAGSGLFLMDGNGQTNGYPTAVSEQVAASEGMIFGNWRELLIGLWGVLDVFGDQFTLGDAGGLVVRGFQDMDVAVRHAASFSVGDTTA